MFKNSVGKSKEKYLNKGVSLKELIHKFLKEIKQDKFDTAKIPRNNVKKTNIFESFIQA